MHNNIVFNSLNCDKKCRLFEKGQNTNRDRGREGSRRRFASIPTRREKPWRGSEPQNFTNFQKNLSLILIQHDHINLNPVAGKKSTAIKQNQAGAKQYHVGCFQSIKEMYLEHEFNYEFEK